MASSRYSFKSNDQHSPTPEIMGNLGTNLINGMWDRFGSCAEKDGI